MEQIDKDNWKQFKAEVKSKLTQDQYKLLMRLHSKYYNHKYVELCSCNPARLVQWISDIDKIYD